MTGERTATKRAAKEQPSRALVAKKRGADSSEQAICLVCWDSERAAELASALSGDGFRVTVVSESVKGWVGYFRDLSVDAVVIDLSRLPSHGREVGIMLRGSKSTRHMPLVFLDGTAEKVERVRGELPDAVFTAWDEAASAIRRAIQTPVENPVRPVQMMERSNRRDLVRRLGVKADVPVVLWGDAEFLVEMLGDVPLVKKKQGNAAHLCLCVTRSALDVEAAFETVASGYPAGTLVWIIHPKQAGRIKVDFNQNDVRALGLARRWVDFKVCAVDADWSGLAFARRKTGEALPRRSMNPMMARR